MLNYDLVVSTEVEGVSLRFMTSDEINRQSSSELQNAGRLGIETTEKSCIHDSALGYSDILKICSTCNETSNCDGHVGHIKFAIPVYHPLLLSELVKLLKTVCLYCHEFKHSGANVAVYVAILDLMQHGYPAEAKVLIDHILEKRQAFKCFNEFDGSFDVEALGSAIEANCYERIRACFLDTQNGILKSSDKHLDVNLWNEVRSRFFNSAAARSKCPHCSRGFKYSLRPTADFSSLEMSWTTTYGNVPIVKDYLNNVSAINDELVVACLQLADLVKLQESSRLGTGGKSLKILQMNAFHLVPLLHSIFTKHKKLLHCLFPQSRELGYKLFLMQNMGVPANRFRPPLVTPEKQIVLHARSDALLDIVLENQLLGLLLKVGKSHKNDANAAEADLIAEFLSYASDDRQMANFQSLIKSSGGTIKEAIGTCCLNLQRKVSFCIDTSKSATTNKAATLKPGIKQTMEHKEGTVRQNMLGKRVNFSARTVIAPDAFIGTNQIGVPLNFCTELTVPEYVTRYNVNLLRRLVLNGAKKWPGANYISDVNGKVYKLSALGTNERKAKAKLLLTGGDVDGKLPRVVYRHVMDGDVVLMNRQPTLHKPGIMGHFVKVLTNQKTFRLNYVNCNTYNADFDGDEMNLHLPQDYKAQAEAQYLANADCQFTVPKDGQPIRGLIQDHCQGGAFLTSKDTILTLQEYCQLVYIALDNVVVASDALAVLKTGADTKCNFQGISIDNKLYHFTKRFKNHGNIFYNMQRGDNGGKGLKLEPPAILYPQKRWTGKQVITTILKNLIDPIAYALHKDDLKFAAKYKGINLYSKSKTPGDAWGGVLDGDLQESQIVVLNSELLQGVLDKSQFGATPYGLVHLVYEFLGPQASGMLLNSFALLFSAFLQTRGATCSPKDLLLTYNGELKREKILAKIRHCGLYIQALFLAILQRQGGSDNTTDQDTTSLEQNAADMAANATELKRSLEELANATNFTEDDYQKAMEILGKMINEKSQLQSPLLSKIAQVANQRSVTQHLKMYNPSWLSNASDTVATKTTTIDGETEKELTAPSSNKDVTDFRIGDAIHTCDEMYRLILKRYGGNVHVFYRSFDRFFQSNIVGASAATSDIVDETFVKFPKNGFAGMVTTGAKGSKVNFSMICSVLNQQTLEGRRVPVMPSVRTLPSFAFGDFGARAGGYITDRFLTGLRPQEYFFHCMSGREGLVDTCVKTAKSGYLQRCVLKAMEDVVCCYDHTVRNSDGNIIQFYYGEDGINVQYSAYLNRHEDVLLNKVLLSRLDVTRGTNTQCQDLQVSTSQKFKESVDTFTSNEDDKRALYLHYNKCACEAGEAVGCIAGQSIGEPATQMTLNTFHLAGHGASNVTLGIPRLVEILQNTSCSATPWFSAPLLGDTDVEVATNAQVATNAMRQVPLSDVVESIGIDYGLYTDACGNMQCNYVATIKFDDLDAFYEATRIARPSHVIKVACRCLLARFLKRVAGLLVVTMDTNVLHEVSDVSDPLQRAWECIDKNGTTNKLADRIRKMVLSRGGTSATNSGAVGSFSSGNIQLEYATSSAPGGNSAHDSTRAEGLPFTGSGRSLDSLDEYNDAYEHQNHHEDDYGASEADGKLDSADEMEYTDDDDKSNDSDDSDSSIDQGTHKLQGDVGGISFDAKKRDKRTRKALWSSGKSLRSVGAATATSPNASVKGTDKFLGVNIKVFQYAKKLRYNRDDGTLTLHFGWPYNKCPYYLDLLPLLKQQVSSELVRTSKGILAIRILSDPQENTFRLHCDGTNIQRLFQLPEGLVDFNRIKLNDIVTAFRFYGIEAARSCLVSELHAVFSFYGIDVDYRHLTLIADFMTQAGDLRAFTRYGMARHSSPLLQMSFESTIKFLVDASIRSGLDNLKTPAGAIVAGKPVHVGAGLCRLMPMTTYASCCTNTVGGRNKLGIKTK